MLIGSKYAENKVYKGIKYYDSLPLTSSDMHEYADTVRKKNEFLMNNLIGSGIINKPGISISSEGISLTTPSILLLDGDISLIQSDSRILKVSDIESSGINNGVLCAVGWYQHLDSMSTLRNYGGVNNSPLPFDENGYNELLDKDTGIQVSTRYQFRWDTVIIDSITFNSDTESISFDLKNRDARGEITGGVTRLTTSSKVGSIRLASKPASMDYSLSDLYIVPILQYDYSDSIFKEVTLTKPLKISGSVGLVKSSSKPTRDLEEGLLWYNTESKSFQMYIAEIGFIPLFSMIENMNVVEMSRHTTPADISFPIGLKYTEGDILKVVYEGLLLTEGDHYSISEDKSTITLLQFITDVGEKVLVSVISADTNESLPDSGGSSGGLIIF